MNRADLNKKIDALLVDDLTGLVSGSREGAEGYNNAISEIKAKTSKLLG